MINTGQSSRNKTGIFVAVVGPSGAGKDSILREAANILADDNHVHFVRRIVTRDADSNEDHDTVTEDEFTQLTASGAFALHWQANGLSYGISAGIFEQINAGRIVIANVSRTISATIKTLFPRSLIVHITASETVLGHRLAFRGREELAERERRIARSKALEGEFDADIRIENNGELVDAVQQFVKAILALKPSTM